jgi:hypothetical protein
MLAFTRLALLIGVALVAITGIVIAGVSFSPTALLPGILGVVLIAAGFIGERRPTWKRHAMHIAVAAALLGALGSLRVFSAFGDPDANPVVIAGQMMTLMLCAIFVVLGIRSFIEARRARPS